MLIVKTKRKIIVYTVCILLFYNVIYLTLVNNWRDNTSPHIYLQQKGHNDVILTDKEIIMQRIEGMWNFFTTTFNGEKLKGYICRNVNSELYYTKYMK